MDEKELWATIPFKRTIIGEERSMPDKTTIWFITDEEYTELRRKVSGEKRKYRKRG